MTKSSGFNFFISLKFIYCTLCNHLGQLICELSCILFVEMVYWRVWFLYYPSFVYIDGLRGVFTFCDHSGLIFVLSCVLCVEKVCGEILHSVIIVCRRVFIPHQQKLKGEMGILHPSVPSKYMC